MAPTVVSGVRSTTNALASSRRIVDMANEIFQYDPDVTPMLAFVQGRAATERTGNPSSTTSKTSRCPHGTRSPRPSPRPRSNGRGDRHPAGEHVVLAQSATSASSPPLRSRAARCSASPASALARRSPSPVTGTVTRRPAAPRSSGRIRVPPRQTRWRRTRESDDPDHDRGVCDELRPDHAYPGRRVGHRGWVRPLRREGSSLPASQDGDAARTSSRSVPSSSARRPK
jgi:hypothetical protein